MSRHREFRWWATLNKAGTRAAQWFPKITLPFGHCCLISWSRLSRKNVVGLRPTLITSAVSAIVSGRSLVAGGVSGRLQNSLASILLSVSCLTSSFAASFPVSLKFRSVIICLSIFIRVPAIYSTVTPSNTATSASVLTVAVHPADLSMIPIWSANRRVSKSGTANTIAVVPANGVSAWTEWSCLAFLAL